MALRACLSATVIFCLVLVFTVKGQEGSQYVSQPDGTDVASRFNAMQSELANLQTRLADIENSQTYVGYSHGCDRPIGGWYGGFELVIVRPHFQSQADFTGSYGIIYPGSGDGGRDAGGGDAAGGKDAYGGKDGIGGGGDGDGGRDGPVGDAAGGDAYIAFQGGTPQTLQPSYGFQGTPRFFVGWRNDEGLGFRGRYWLMNASSGILVNQVSSNIDQFFNQSLNMQALDLEMTQMNCLGGFEIELGGGVRYGHVRTATTADVYPGIYTPTRIISNFDGFGPTAALNIRRPLGWDNWALVGSGRGSLHFGQTNFTQQIVPDGDTTIPINAGKVPFDIVPVFETQVGLERNWWGEYGRFAVRGMLEAQWWGNAGSSPASNIPNQVDGNDPFRILYHTDQDIGLIGANISFVYEH